MEFIVFHLMMLDQVTIRYGPRWRKSCLNAVRLSDGAYQQFNGDEERPAAKHEQGGTGGVQSGRDQKDKYQFRQQQDRL